MCLIVMWLMVSSMFVILYLSLFLHWVVTYSLFPSVMQQLTAPIHIGRYVYKLLLQLLKY
jgi:hypothetical protein